MLNQISKEARETETETEQIQTKINKTTDFTLDNNKTDKDNIKIINKELSKSIEKEWK